MHAAYVGARRLRALTATLSGAAEQAWLLLRELVTSLPARCVSCGRVASADSATAPPRLGGGTWGQTWVQALRVATLQRLGNVAGSSGAHGMA